MPPVDFSSRIARCEAAYPSRVITRGVPLCRMARLKNRFAALTSRRSLTVLRRRSTASRVMPIMFRFEGIDNNHRTGLLQVLIPQIEALSSDSLPTKRKMGKFVVYRPFLEFQNISARGGTTNHKADWRGTRGCSRPRHHSSTSQTANIRITPNGNVKVLDFDEREMDWQGSFFAFPEIVFILDFDQPTPLSYGGAMRSRRVLSLCLTLLFAAHSGVAQQSTARLLGTVKDQTGAVIPGAMVKATNVGTGQERMIRTNEGGDYSIPLLPIGEYTFLVEAAGFKTGTVRGLVLQVNQEARVDMTLNVGDTAETIAVEAAAPLLATDTSSVGQVIENKAIANMPLNGRAFWQ